MNRLRNRLIAIFLAATLAPLGATLWMTTRLLEHSLSYASTGELDEISKSLHGLGLEYYRHMCDHLKAHAQSGSAAPEKFAPAQRAQWPEAVNAFAESLQAEQFVLAGKDGDRLDYLARHGDEVWRYSARLGSVGLERVSRQIRKAHALVEEAQQRDLRRGFTLTYVVLACSFWLAALSLLVFLAYRVSRPIQRLTAGLSQLAAGDLNARVLEDRDDEVGRAIWAFNDMAGKLQESTGRLVYLTQMASWQMLARKMAHELKNSLTPIRLTVEEMAARSSDADRAFTEQATQIVVEEVESLERRIRAFSQLAAEPPVRPAPLDVNAALQERISFLKTAHPEVSYDCRLAEDPPAAMADPDLVRGILTNLLENAADAAGDGGQILGITSAVSGMVAIEVHDSGPGLNEQQRKSVFQPTISFKKRGMGLGLSIARKSALLSGGDIQLVKGELGGAAFRVLLPATHNGS